MYRIMLRTEDLSYYVKHKVAGKEHIIKFVDGVDLEVEEGSITVIYGDRYSGKYFLTRMLTGLIKPSKGRVFYNDMELTSLSDKELMPIRRKVQTFFMDPMHVFGFKSVGTHLKWLEEVFESREYKWIFEEFLSKYGVNYSDSHFNPDKLSIYKLYLIYVASGLLAEPEMIILENPTALIEYGDRDVIHKFIMELRDRFGLTILVTTSDTALLNSVPDYIYILFRGRIVEEGLKDDVVENPSHPYTMKLLSDRSYHDVSDTRFADGESATLFNWSICPYSFECEKYSEACNIDVPLFEWEHKKIRCTLYQG